MSGTGGGMEGGSLHVTSGLPWFWPRWIEGNYPYNFHYDDTEKTISQNSKLVLLGGSQAAKTKDADQSNLSRFWNLQSP